MQLSHPPLSRKRLLSYGHDMGDAMDSVGLARGHVAVLQHDPRWPEVFAAVAGTVAEALGGHARAVEHVGSTAVSGLAAKPVIDVAVAVSDDVDLSSCIEALTSAGLDFRGDQASEGGWLFVLGPPTRRLAHVHLVASGGRQWMDYLAFRDQLRENPRTRQEYDDLKRLLAADHPSDRAAYTAAKNDFIQQVLRSARPDSG